jgi:hypothetical protein
MHRSITAKDQATLAARIATFTERAQAAGWTATIRDEYYTLLIARRGEEHLTIALTARGALSSAGYARVEGEGVAVAQFSGWKAALAAL